MTPSAISPAQGVRAQGGWRAGQVPRPLYAGVGGYNPRRLHAAPERAACSSPACGLHCYNTSEHSEHHNRNQPVIFEQTGDIAGNVSVPD